MSPPPTLHSMLQYHVVTCRSTKECVSARRALHMQADNYAQRFLSAYVPVFFSPEQHMLRFYNELQLHKSGENLPLEAPPIARPTSGEDDEETLFDPSDTDTDPVMPDLIDLAVAHKEWCDHCLREHNIQVPSQSPLMASLRNESCPNHDQYATINTSKSVYSTSPFMKDFNNIINGLDNPLVHRFIIPASLFFVSYTNARTTLGKASACLSFLQGSVGFKEPVKELASLFTQIPGVFARPTSSSSFPESPLEWAEAHFAALESATQTGSYPLLVKTITIIGCLPLLRHLGIHKTLDSLGLLDVTVTQGRQRTDQLVVDLLRNVLTVVRHFVGANTPGRMTFNQFVSSVSTLEQNLSNRAFGTPVEGKMLNAEYLSLLSSCLSYQRKVQQSFSSMSLPERHDHMFYFRQLDSLAQRSLPVTNTQREPPFVMGLTGIPGCGKTDISELMHRTALEALGYTHCTSDNVFWKNGTEWWDGYNPAHHFGVTLDEINGLLPKHGGQINVKNLQNWLMINGEAQFLTPQAEAHNKSQFPLQAKTTVNIANAGDYGVREYITCTDAFGRRFAVKFHVVCVKDEYRNPEDGTIVPSLVPEGTIDTVWFRQEYWESGVGFKPIVDAQSRDILLDIYQVLDITRHKAQDHRDVIKRKMDRRKASTFGAPVCPHGFFASCRECGIHNMPSAVEERVYRYDSKEQSAPGQPEPNPAAHAEPEEQPLLGGSGHDPDDNVLYTFTSGHIPGPRECASPASPAGTLAPLTVRSVGSDVKSMLYHVISFLVWWIVIATFNIIVFAMDINTADMLGRYYKRQIRAHSTWLHQALTLPKSAEEILSRYEDRVLSPFVDVRDYRGLIRALSLVVLAAGAYKVVARMTAPTPYNQTGGVLSGDSPRSPVQVAALGKPVESIKLGRSVWANPEVYLPFGPSCHNGSPLPALLLDNLVKLSVGGEFTHALCLYGQCYIYAAHTDILASELTVSENKTTMDGNEWVKVWKNQLAPGNVAQVNAEVNLVFIPGLRARRDIRMWMFQNVPSGITTYKGKCIDYVDSQPRVDAVSGKYTNYFCLEKGKQVPKTGLVTDTATPSYAGRCGTPLILEIDGKSVLGGINVAGVVDTASRKCIYHPVDLASVTRAVSRVTAICVFTSSAASFDDTLAAAGVDPTATITRHHHHHWAKQLGTEVILAVDPKYGSSSMKSNVVIDGCKEDVFEAFPAMHHNLVTPEFNHTRVNGEYVSKEGHALKALTENYSRGFDLAILDGITDHLFAKWEGRVPHGSLHVLTIDTAARGSSCLSHFNPARRSTSAGWPLAGKKGDHMVPGPAPDAPDGFVADETVKARIQMLLDKYTSGERGNAVWVAHFKDEPRAADKVALRKIRMFSGGEFSYLLLTKSVTGMLVNAILSQPAEFETMCGVNCFSSDWGKLFAERHKGGTGVIGSDFSSFDKNLPAIVMQYVFTLLIHFMRVWYSDWCAELEAIAAGILTDCCYPVILIDGLFCEFAASNPSGQFLTLMCNGLAQSYLMRYAFCTAHPELTTQEALSKFEDRVVLSTLGDDGTQTVHDVPQYTFSHIQREMALHGMILTSADKAATAADFDPPGTNSIGKRSILSSEGRTLCPMEMAAIGKMLTTCSSKNTIPMKDKMTLSFDAAASEFAMYGREFYSTNIGTLRNIAVKHGYASAWLLNTTFDDIIKRFDSASLAPHIPFGEDETERATLE